MVAAITVAKYGFLSIIMTGAGFLIANVTKMKHIRTREDLVYRPNQPLSYESLSNLDKDFTKCLTEPSKSFCLLSLNKRLELFKSKNHPEPPSLEQIKNRLNNITASHRRNHSHPLHKLIEDFSKLMQSLGVELVLIEPSILFCMLSTSGKLFLMEKGYHPAKLEGSRNVVTFGTFEDEAEILDKDETAGSILSMGFEISRTRKWRKIWQWEEERYERNFSTVHYLFKRRQLTAHVVVFYRRGNFLWHFGLPAEVMGGENLLFHKQGLYENFTGLPLDTEEDVFSVSIPSNFLYFLLQIETSNFLECRVPEVGVIEDGLAAKHPTFFTSDQLKVRAIITIGELKAKLFPETAPFWLWSETLVGWYLHCDIFRYSTEIHLAVALKTLQATNFTENFGGNEYLKVVKDQSLASTFKLDCHGLSVNIYIAHEDENEIWHEERSEDATSRSRFVYEKFALCSTDIFGYKVNVPCAPELIFEAEYGSNWTDLGFFESGNYKLNRRNLLNGTDEHLFLRGH